MDAEASIRNIDWVFTSAPVAVISGDVINVNKTENASGIKKAFVDAVIAYFDSQCIHSVSRGSWDVKITKSGVVNSLAHGFGRDKLNAFAAVPAIIQQGKIIDEQRDWKKRGYDSSTIAASFIMNEEEYIGEVIVNHHKDKSHTFYLHEVAKKSKLLGGSQSGYETSLPRGASKLIIIKKLRKVKPKTAP